MRTLFLFAVVVALTGCPALSFLGENCSVDGDCPDTEVCSQKICVLKCGEGIDCPDGQTCATDGHCLAEVIPDEDAGPNDDAGPPDDFEVALAADLTSVPAGTEVTLSWTTHPVADTCTLYVQTPFDSVRGEVFGAPTLGASSFVAEPEQDSEFTIACSTADGLADEAAVSVDVTAAGTLNAEPSQVNGDASSELSWETNGVSDCGITGPASFSFDIAIGDVQAGSTTLPAAVSGTYALVCEGDELDSVTIEVARVSLDEVTPTALGVDPVEVTLTYTYTGPDADSCVVLANDVAAPDEQAAEAGHQVTVSATTTLKVECDGYAAATLSAETTVEQLITSFSGPPDAIDYGADATLTFETAEGTTCALAGETVTSPHQVTVTASGEHELTCTKGDLSATATVSVSVRPGFVGEELTGTLTKEAAADPEADVVLLATPTLNASACSVSASHFATPVAMDLSSTEADHKVFELAVARNVDSGPTADGVVTYTVACESEPSVSAASGGEVVVWWGGLAAADLGNFGTSGATLVTGALNLFSANSPDFDGADGQSGISKLQEVGGTATLSSMVGVQFLTGFENLSRILGNLALEGNLSLRELTFGTQEGLVALQFVMGDVTVAGNYNSGTATGMQTAALPSLEEIGGGLTISSNSDLDSIGMSALEKIGGVLTISSNGDLDEISMSALSSVAGALTISECPVLIEGATPAEGFDALVRVQGNFALLDSSISSVTSYFPALDEVTGLKFEVENNASLPCANGEELYCRLSPPPAQPSIRFNMGNCQVIPSCP